jgi:hypothetical protein
VFFSGCLKLKLIIKNLNITGPADKHIRIVKLCSKTHIVQDEKTCISSNYLFSYVMEKERLGNSSEDVA